VGDVQGADGKKKAPAENPSAHMVEMAGIEPASKEFAPGRLQA